jgi:hypothetical protein
MSTRDSHKQRRSAIVKTMLAAAAAAAVVVGLVGASPAGAATPAVAWSIHTDPLPSVFTAEDNSHCPEATTEGFGCDAYEVDVTDAGARAADGSPIVLSDDLPAGVTVHYIAFHWSGLPRELGGEEADLSLFGLCSTSPVQCTLPTAEFGLPPVAPDDRLQMTVYVKVPPGLPGSLTDTAAVSGGGALSAASTTVQNPVNTTPASFGFSSFTSALSGVDGAPDTQAGGHPYELNQRIDLASKYRISPEGDDRSRAPLDVREARDVVVDLPPGVVGSVLAAPKCPLVELSTELLCPASTRIGHILTGPSDGASVDSDLYNMVPERGVVAEFGYTDATRGAHMLYVSVAPTPAGYVLRTTSPDIPQTSLSDITATVDGNPAARDGTGNAPVALFTNPSSCTGEPLITAIHQDAWGEPGSYNADGTPDFTDPLWAGANTSSAAVSGCDQLQFEPSLSIRPETSVADSPTGVLADLQVPQHEEPETLAAPPLRDAHVALPVGLAINPSAAGGLASCSEAQIGWHGGSLYDFDAAQPACPEASKVGSVEVETPAVSGVLQGSIYLATQNENPLHSLLAGYIVIDDPTTGVLVKLAGDLTPDPQTGQIMAVFDENPQFPVSDLRLRFYGGPRGEVATPTGCGTYTTTSDLMPWSAPDSGPDATPSSSFPIETGCGNGFAPGFVAGTTNPQAGGYAPFTLSLTRNDGEQNLAGVTVTLPEGLLGKIAGIPLCPDAQVNTGTCPEASRVGSVTAGAGVGPDPYFVSGNAYLTGPYNGGPYGLVVEVPAVAGPFDLGTVVVRQSLRIDPHTAQVTAVSDPFPTILQGIPLQVRRVDVTLDRPGFTFNPTSCAQLAIDGTITSAQGATASVSNRFQAGGCGELPFKPSFKVATAGKSSRQNGASLTVNVTSRQGQANIGKVAVSLPKQLPARLTTIQQACPEATYNQNPASCPAGSDIGTATAHTPVLANPLVGPAYLVSHGGAAFPNLVLILQGEGITLDLVGSIDIKQGVTSSAFNAVPDAPINSFELSIPEGPHSGLASNLPAKAKGDFCGQSLVMPTTITGQNGAVVKQSTKIAVTGCPKAKPKKEVKAKSKHPRKGGKKRK